VKVLLPILEQPNVKIAKNSLRLLIIAAGFAVFNGCISNPFGGDKISSEKRTITGTVRLADQADAKDIYVWLNGFNISTSTNEQGGFEINLPPKSSQSANGAISGIFTLYFYMANYHLDSAQVVVQDGAFAYSRGDINKDGKLSAPRSLRRFLKIKSEALPPSAPSNFAFRIGVVVTLEAVIDSATVVFPGSVGGLLGACYFKRVGSEEVLILESVTGAQTRDVAVVGRVPTERLMAFTLVNFPLQPGQYQLIPYLLMGHEALPAGLVQSLGADVEKLGPNYLKLPFRREDGIFEVKP
jgi:hypothetical protein